MNFHKNNKFIVYISLRQNLSSLLLNLNKLHRYNKTHTTDTIEREKEKNDLLFKINSKNSFN